MENKQNLHTHTNYVDGKDTPEEMILTAIERGFVSIGFSDHSLTKNSILPRKMTPDAFERYKTEIRELKEKYKGALDIFCGLEYDFYSDVSTDGLDYLIGSVHYLDCDGEVVSFDKGLPETLAYIQDYFGGDSLRFTQKYYETMSRLTEKKQFDIIGHFDILTKNNERGNFLDTNSKAYLDMGLEAIHALKGKVPLFEVNTGAISRGYRTAAYPQMEFLKEFACCGFGAVITTDCHDRTLFDFGFEEAGEILAQAGFKTKWILTDNGFKEVPL